MIRFKKRQMRTTISGWIYSDFLFIRPRLLGERECGIVRQSVAEEDPPGDGTVIGGARVMNGSDGGD